MEIKDINQFKDIVKSVFHFDCINESKEFPNKSYFLDVTIGYIDDVEKNIMPYYDIDAYFNYDVESDVLTVYFSYGDNTLEFKDFKKSMYYYEYGFEKNYMLSKSLMKFSDDVITSWRELIN